MGILSVCKTGVCFAIFVYESYLWALHYLFHGNKEGCASIKKFWELIA
jgi:hypothetical protein